VADDINSIVAVAITANSKTPSQVGFGTPLILTYHSVFADNYRVYSDVAGMVSDGFTSSHEAYRKAAAAFAQNPAPEQVVVGRLTSAPSFVTQVKVTSAVEAQHIKFKVIEPVAGTIQQIDRTIPAASSTTAEATAIEILVEAFAGVDSSSSTDTISITPTVAGRKVHVYDCVNCAVKETTADANYSTVLDSLSTEYNDWYFISLDSASPANAADVAAWVLANKNVNPKFYFVATSDTDLLAGTATSGTFGEFATAAESTSNDHVVSLYVPNSQEGADIAWASVIGVQTPGSITAALKTLVGVTPGSLTTTQRTNLEAINVNHYQTVRGLNVTRQGKVGSGEWIDVVHGIDALKSDLQGAVFGLLAGSGKVPFTPAGLNIIEATIKGVLKRYEGSDDQPGLIAPKSSRVVMPKFSTITTTDKANRELRNVRFSGILAGAIQFVSLLGTLTNA
jgi:hypothetical protein